MTNKEAFIRFNKALNEAILKQQATKDIKASGNFERFIQSDESIKELSNERFLKVGTHYTKEIDVGRKATPKRTGGLVEALYEWLQYKKYNISYENDKQRLGIAIAIAKNMNKLGSWKRRNPSDRTKIIETAINESKPTLFRLLTESAIFSIESKVQDEIEKINKEK